MSQKPRLLYLNTEPEREKQVSKYINATDFDFLVEPLPSPQNVKNVISKSEPDLVLLDSIEDGWMQEGGLPFILIVGSEDEDSAITALEQGKIAEYVLSSPAGYKRLSFVVRAVLAREKRVELARSVSEFERTQRLAQLKGNFDSIVIVDKFGKIVFWTQNSMIMSGYSEIEIESITPFELVHKNDLNRIQTLFSSVIANPGKEEAGRVRVLHKDGTWHWYDVVGKNMLNDPLVQGVLVRFNNVTKRMQDHIQNDAVYRIAQAALVTSSLDSLFVSIHMIISEVMPSENFYIALYDWESTQVNFPYYQDSHDEPPPGPAELDNGLTAYVLKSGKSLLINQDNFVGLREQGKVSLVGTEFAIWLGVPLFIGKQPIGIMCVQDYDNENAYGERERKLLEFVSSQVAFAIYRKQADAELRENESRFRSLFENSSVGIYRSTPDGHLLLANSALLNISGYESLDELMSIDLNEFGYFYADDRIRFQKLLELDGEVRALESLWRRKDGSAIFVRESARLIKNELTGEIFYEGVVEDITERKKAELALKEKVVALETLAEIDTEILLTKDSSALLELVCRRAVDLLGASKACIATIGDSRSAILAIHGFQDPDSARREFFSDANLKIFNRRKSFMIRDFSKKNFLNLMSQTRERENIHSVIAEAFHAGTDFQAVFTVFNDVPRKWTDDDRQLLKFLTGQVALSLEKTGLLNDAERRAKDFQTLYSLGTEIASRRDFEILLDVIIKSVTHLFDTPCGFIYIYDEDRKILRLTTIRGVNLETGFSMEIGEGLAGKVAKSRKPKRVDNYRTWRYRRPQLDKFHLSAILAVPMIYSGQLIGVLAVSDIGETKRKFTDDDTRLLALFAGQAASAVFNARLFSQIQQRNEELDRLYRALGMLIAGVSSNRYELCQGICDIILTEFNQTSCEIWLLNEGSSYLEEYGSTGGVPRKNFPLRLDGDGLIPKVIRENNLLNVGNVLEHKEYLAGRDETKSELIIPLTIDEKVVGAIDLQSPNPFAFSENDERLVALFADRAALMLEHVRLVEQTEERNRRLDTLHAIETSFASSVNLKLTLDSLTKQIHARLSVDTVLVHLYDNNLKILEYVAGFGFLADLKFNKIRIGEGLVGSAALDQEIIYVPNLTQPGSASQVDMFISTEEFISGFIVPVIAKGQLHGVLQLYYRRFVRNDPEWIGFLETLARQVAVAIDGMYAFDQVQRSLLEQQVAQDSAIESWSWLLESRGLEPAGHGKRVTAACLNLAQYMGISGAKLADIYRGALLHDVGKLFLPDSIVYKKGSLTEAERQQVYQHPVHAKKLLERISLNQSAYSIPYCHHENWDGSGYPRGLKGEDIPVDARIFRVIETWDLMQVDLSYRKAMTETEVLEYIQLQAGKLFDPNIVERFLRMLSSLPR